MFIYINILIRYYYLLLLSFFLLIIIPVRSLASVAYRKAMDHETKFHFNFFAVNINEELGALYGPVLERQTEFVTFAIQHILKLYEDSPKKPKSVVIIGHSMVSVENYERMKDVGSLIPFSTS